MNALARYRLARGVRLRPGDCGEALMLVPEGIVRLSESAAAVLELVDGERDTAAIARLLAERFEASAGVVARDVDELLAAFVRRGYVVEA